jgi:RNA polymerase sigma-54 factor
VSFMATKISQELKLGQGLVMTPALQQAIKILTLNHLELTQMISNELVENPMLEEIEDDEKKIDSFEDERGKEEELFKGSSSELDWDEYVDSYNVTSSTDSQKTFDKSSDGDEMLFDEKVVAPVIGLSEHLENQLRFEKLTKSQFELAWEIIHNLGSDGYLETPLEEFLIQSELDLEEAEGVLKIIQGLDPVGCASRNLQECLLAQAEHHDENHPLVEALLRFHIEDININKSDIAVTLAKKLNALESDVSHALKIISTFDPRPGQQVTQEKASFIIPDLFVFQMSGEWIVQMNEEGIPRLAISQYYQKYLKRNKNKIHSNHNNSHQNDEAHDYIQEKMKNALWLIKSLNNRQKAIFKVACAIVGYQQDFFNRGFEHLRPMVLKDVALEIGVHESTVSRVTTNKYMQTPLGTFELKYFFNSGIGGKDGGQEVPVEILKQRIKKIINQENPKNPISDQEVVNILKDEGVNLARRTVAKYRESLNIPASSKRKK